MIVRFRWSMETRRSRHPGAAASQDGVCLELVTMNLIALQHSVLAVLQAYPNGISEYDLIQHLKKRHLSPFADLTCGHRLSLYRCHFLLFHLLYRLRDDLLTSREALLTISPLKIRLEPYVPPAQQGLAEPDPLRDYYLDFRHFDDTTDNDVQDMLDSFWQKLQQFDQRKQALAVLGLHDPVDLATIKKRYRELAMAHHPDRGGSAERQQAINHAMAVLRVCYSEPPKAGR